MGVRLPPEYQEVEYLKATGTQAFFTDVPIQDGLTVDSVQTFMPSDSYLFGGYTDTGFRACFNGYYGGCMQSAYNGYYTWGNSVFEDDTTIYNVVLTQAYGSQIGYINGTRALQGTRTGTPEPSGSGYCVAFGQRNITGAINLWYKGKVYSLKVSKDGVQLADYVPCYRKQDTKPGMYDLVSKTFYTNQGTGEFLVGPDVIDHVSPWLVARRRGLMMQMWPIERWTYILFADSSGRIPKTKIPVYAGQHVHAEWDTTSVSRNIGDDTIFSFYTQQSQPFTTGSPWYMTPMRGANGYPILWKQQGSQIAFISGVVDFEIPADLTMYVSCWSESEYEGATERGLYGSYLKIRIT